MKKALSLCLAALLALSLCACGSSEKKTSSKPSSKAESDTEASSRTSAAASTEGTTAPIPNPSAAKEDFFGTWNAVEFPEIDYFVHIGAELEATLTLNEDMSFELKDSVTINQSLETETLSGTYTISGAQLSLKGSSATVMQNGQTSRGEQDLTLSAVLQVDNTLALTTTDNQTIIFEKSE